MELSAYTISLSFQYTGTLLLLLVNFSLKSDDILKAFISNSDVVHRDNDTKESHYSMENLVNIFRQRVYNIISFQFLIVGYSLGICEFSNSHNKVTVLLSAAFLTILWCLATKFIVALIVFYKTRRRYFNISDNDMVRLNLAPTIETITKSEIDRMFADGITKTP